jgi:DMSO reductase anchor subunit
MSVTTPVLLLTVQMLGVALLYVTGRPELVVAETVAMPFESRVGTAAKLMVCVAVPVLLPPLQLDSTSAAQATKTIPNPILL